MRQACDEHGETDEEVSVTGRLNVRDVFINEDYILFDGAIGTQIYAKGIPKGHCYDELNSSMPEVILDIHREYIEAGAKVITSNTFGANRFILEEYYDLGGKTEEINYYGARLAKRAAKENAFVAGSVGPVTRPLDKETRLTVEEVAAMVVFLSSVSAVNGSAQRIEGGIIRSIL